MRTTIFFHRFILFQAEEQSRCIDPIIERRSIVAYLIESGSLVGEPYRNQHSAVTPPFPAFVIDMIEPKGSNRVTPS